MSTCIEYSHNINIKNTGVLSFDIQVKGVLIKYKKKIYLTLPHAGLDVNKHLYIKNIKILNIQLE